MVVKGAVGQEVHIVGVIDSIHIDKNGVKYDISLKSLENRFLRLGEKDILVIEPEPEEMHFAEQITVTKEENAAAAEEKEAAAAAGAEEAPKRGRPKKATVEEMVKKATREVRK